MTDISPVKVAAPKAANTSAAPATASGGSAPGAFAALFGDASQTPATGANGLPEDRQGEADDGKTLPGEEDAPDPRLMWLPFALPPVPAETQAPAAAALPQVAAAKAQATDVAAKPDDLDQIAGDTAASNRLVAMFNTAERMAAAQADKAAKLIPPAPVVAEVIAASPSLKAAIETFVQPLNDDPKKPVFEPVAAATSLTTEAVLRHAVQATGDANNVPLDLRNDQGLRHMIDRIEMLRDDANANDTRIRLVPDALGGVDVAVRRAGDALHVHFTTDTEHARALIAEAQPRLVELAEARGVRIADASVQTGTGNDRSAQQQFQQQPQQAQNRTGRPASANDLSTPTESTGDDARLA